MIPGDAAEAAQAARPRGELAGRTRFLLVWTAIGVGLALQWLPYRERMGVPGWSIVLHALVYNSLWASLWPLITWVVRRLLVARRSWVGHVVVQVPVGVALCLVHQSVYYGFSRAVKAVAGVDNYRASWVEFVSSAGGFALVFFGLVVAAAYVVELSRMVRERQRRAEALQEQLAIAQVQALKLQLQPHFLFNTLNSIQALMDVDVPAAQDMVARLADFLRATLGVPADGLVSLQRELELADAYLYIEKVRFPDRLEGEIERCGALPPVRVPALILQPLIENSVRHGVAPYRKPGAIRIRAESTGGTLRLSVWDSGPGMDAHEPVGLGVGLANVKERLRLHYGDAASLRLTRAPTGGFEASITVPLEEAS